MINSPDEHLDKALRKLAKFLTVSTAVGMASFSVLSPENLSKVGRALIGLQSISLMGCLLLIYSLYKSQQEIISEIGEKQ